MHPASRRPVSRNAEADIRRALVRRGYIKGIIGLPANLFYGTGIPACIVVIDKEQAHARKGIFMIDASAGFMKDGPKNRLRAQDMLTTRPGNWWCGDLHPTRFTALSAAPVQRRFITSDPQNLPRHN